MGSMYYRSPSLKLRTPEEFLEPMLTRSCVMLRDIAIKELEAYAVLTATTVRYRRELTKLYA